MSASEPAFWRVASVSGGALDCLRGAAEGEVMVVACRETCGPIPWQLDERDADGALALDGGPEPTHDDPPGVVDDNDELLWMAADAGRRMRAEEIPAAARCRLALAAGDPDDPRWAYAFVVPAPAPRSALRYVDYDTATDTVSGARVALGFGAATPRLMRVRDGTGEPGANLLDRLKVRASARFLGVIPLGRDEDDIEWEFGGWRAGPIRVVRREWQWVRLGWRLRTPIFQTETLVTRDSIELPVRLRLNFPPTYFFRAIEVQAALDFRDLSGWRLLVPGAAAHLIGGGQNAAAAALNEREADWLALAGPNVTFVLRLQLGDSLASLRTRLLYREDADGFEPEAVPGERPAVGFRLTDWGEVDRGEHGFAAVAYALPAAYDIDRFAAEQREPFAVRAEPMPVPATQPPHQ